nr:MAG TPA: Repressor protein CI [Caudoviricetes sp.]
MNRIKEAREKRGITQKYVALTLGVKAPSVSAWETGKTLPSAENLAALSELYGVSIDYLMGKDPSPTQGFVEIPGKPETNDIRRQLLTKLEALDDETLRQAASYIDFLASGRNEK